MSDDYTEEVDMDAEADNENALQRMPFSQDIQDNVDRLIDAMEAFTGIAIEDPEGTPNNGKELSDYFQALREEGKLQAERADHKHSFPYVIVWDILPKMPDEGVIHNVEISLEFSWVAETQRLDQLLHCCVRLIEHHKQFSFSEAYDHEKEEEAEFDRMMSGDMFGAYDDQDQLSSHFCTIGENPADSICYEFSQAKAVELLSEQPQCAHLLLRGMEAMEEYFFKTSEHFEKGVLARFCECLENLLPELEDVPSAPESRSASEDMSDFGLEYMAPVNDVNRAC